MIHGDRDSRCAAFAASARLAGILALLVTTGSPASADPAPAAPPRQCQFIDGTLVPRLVMGVRRVNDGEIDALPVRAEQDPDGPAVADARLFRPYYVVARRVDDRKDAWLLIQDGYAAAKPLGWVPERHVEPFRSRYAYTFASRDRDHPADLHDESKDSYERLLAQMKGDPEAGGDLVLVRERRAAKEKAWNPAAIDDIVPFIELRLPSDAIDKEYPDTTPTNRFGIPQENRLVHMGAVCGGPVEQDRLAALRKQDVLGGLEMVFVVDETESMKPFFGGVADFIAKVGRAAAAGNPAMTGQKPARVAVGYYRDGPVGDRVTTSPLATVKDEKAALVLADEVRGHDDTLPPGDFANAPERMLEGLRESVAAAGFTAGSDAFVVVVGDTGHEPTDPGKPKLIDEVADGIVRHGLHVVFAHVGRRKSDADMLFEKDYAAVRKAAVDRGAPAERVAYQAADAGTLADEIGRARERAEKLRRERLRMIERIESRTPYTEPGQKLLRQLEAAKIPRQAFDDDHLQFYVPARGWLFHPIPPPGAGPVEPQFRELFFVAPPERQAVQALFAQIRDRLGKGEPIDHASGVATFAAALAKASGNPALENQVMEAWQAIPAPQRSLGVFLEDVFGLRLKSALPYPPQPLTNQPATAEEIRTLDERVGRLSRAFGTGNAAAVWFEASSLVP